MKIRIFGNSVRVRMSQTEVRALAADQAVEQTTAFSPTSKLVTSIAPSDKVSTVRITFDHQRLALEIPRAQMQRWANSEDVTIAAQQKIDADQSLSILIEKDFECLHKRTKEDEDTYPNPRAG